MGEIRHFNPDLITYHNAAIHGIPTLHSDALMRCRGGIDMSSFVVLDPATKIGQVFASLPDTEFTGDCPALRCSSVDTTLPNYVLATRESPRKEGTGRTYYLPHSAVIAVLPEEPGEPKQFGFGPRSGD